MLAVTLARCACRASATPCSRAMIELGLILRLIQSAGALSLLP